MDQQNNCSMYQCEGGDNHTHIGVQPHLRRVIYKGMLIDGKTWQPPQTLDQIEAQEFIEDQKENS